MALDIPHQLLEAVMNAITDEGQIGTLRQLVEANRGSINHEFVFPHSPFAASLLYSAVLFNAVNVARLLLENGADPDFLDGDRRRDGEGFTLLVLAIVNELEESVAELIRGGANVNVRVTNHAIDGMPELIRSPLSIAADIGNTNIVRMLLENGASVFFVDSRYRKSILQNAKENKYNPEINALIINSTAPANNVPPLPPAPVAARPNTRNHRRTARRRKARRTTRRSHRR
jgi:ankyrin repeat protein